MGAFPLAQAIEHATRSLGAAYDRLHRERPGDLPLSPSHETAEERVRAEVERLSELLGRARTTGRTDPVTLEGAADELDHEVASLDEVLEAEEAEGEA